MSPGWGNRVGRLQLRNFWLEHLSGGGADPQDWDVAEVDFEHIGVQVSTGHPAGTVPILRSVGPEPRGEKQVTEHQMSAWSGGLLPGTPPSLSLEMEPPFVCPIVPDMRFSPEPPSPHVTTCPAHSCLTQGWIKTSEHDSCLGIFFFLI